MEVFLDAFGPMERYLPQGQRHVPLSVEEGATVADLLRKAGIPDMEIGVVAVNGNLAPQDQVLQPGDAVVLFEPIGGGSP